MTESDPPCPWWRRPALLAALVLLGVVPLLIPAMPPLTDLPGHAARWHIAAAGPSSPLVQYYWVDRAWIGNLGTDLPAMLLVPLIGPAATAKLLAILIAALTAGAILMLSREVHGRVAPTAFFALPLAFAWPFQMGFLNFSLSVALALWSLALWLRLGRTGRIALRALLFAPVGLILWTAHSAGWGLFGLMAFAAELARLRQARSWPRAAAGAVIACLPLALPILLMLVNRPAGTRASETGDWFDFGAKFLWFLSSLRDRWQWFDLASLGLLTLLLYLAMRDRRLGFDARLGWPALACLAAFLLLPRLLLGGSYVDMRVTPAIWMLALLAIRPPADLRFAGTLAIAGLAFFAARTGATNLSFALRAAEQQVELAALPAIPRGAPVLALVHKPCRTPWSDKRLDHLPAHAIFTRDAFVNEQWAIAGQQYLRVGYISAGPFTADPSQIVYPPDCPELGRSLAEALRIFPRGAFSHIWVIGHRLPAPRHYGLVTVWSNEGSALYEVIGTAP